MTLPYATRSATITDYRYRGVIPSAVATVRRCGMNALRDGHSIVVGQALVVRNRDERGRFANGWTASVAVLPQGRADFGPSVQVRDGLRTITYYQFTGFQDVDG